MNYGGQCGGNFKYFWRYSTNVKRRIYLGVRTCEFFFVFFTIILQGSTIWYPFSHNATPERIELSLYLASWTEVGPKRTFNNSRTCITLRGQPRGMAGWPFDRSRPLNAGSTDKGFIKNDTQLILFTLILGERHGLKIISTIISFTGVIRFQWPFNTGGKQ